MARVGGIIRVTVDGREIRAKGDFTWNLGQPKNESVIGAGGVHGYKSTPQVSFVEGALTDTADVDLIALTGASESTIIVELPNSKSLILRQAYWAGDGEGTTAEGEFKVRWESPYSAEVI